MKLAVPIASDHCQSAVLRQCATCLRAMSNARNLFRRSGSCLLVFPGMVSRPSGLIWRSCWKTWAKPFRVFCPTTWPISRLRILSKLLVIECEIINRNRQHSILAPNPSFFELNHLPIKAGSPAVTGRTLVIFDAAGELFTSAGGESEKLNFLPSVSTVWLLVSLKDLASGSEPVTISELFYSLQTTLQKLGTESGPSRFVVVFTKADLLSDSLPESVIKYLLDDPLQGLIRNSATVIRGFSVENYLKEAAKISADLEAFAVEQPGGRQFVNLLRRKGVDVSFCAVLTSGAPENEHGACRVLDPLFWTLLHAPKTEPELNRRFTLIVDNHEAGASSSLQSVMQTFRNVLSRRGRTSVYTLGNAVAGPVPGQSPHSAAAASCRPALIGPILERLSKEELVLVLTARQILDLPDFRNTEWRERMLVCSPVEFQDDPWPQTMRISSQQDCEIAVSRLIRPAVEAN